MCAYCSISSSFYRQITFHKQIINKQIFIVNFYLQVFSAAYLLKKRMKLPEKLSISNFVDTCDIVHLTDGVKKCGLSKFNTCK